MTPDKALELIIAELRAAEKKHPGWPEDKVHALAILAEEAGEAVKEALDVHYTGKDTADLVKELAQTGAMALRALIHLPAPAAKLCRHELEDCPACGFIKGAFCGGLKR